MYSTCIVWLAFIPIFFGTHHDYQVSIKASLSFLLFQHNHHHCESLSFPDQSQMTQKSTTNTNITNTNVNIMLLQCWSFVNIISNHHDHQCCHNPPFTTRSNCRACACASLSVPPSSFVSCSDRRCNSSISTSFIFLSYSSP